MARETITLIPSGYKAGKVYSQLPVNGNGDFTFDRGTSTTQTRVNSDGLIEDVGVDIPRLDYSDGGCPSLLLEPATTNLITYSEEFDNAAWIKTGSTISSNVILSPDGSVNADLLTIDSGTSQHRTFINATISGSVNVTGSVFLKQGTTNLIQIVTGSSSGNGYVNIDLSNGLILNEGSVVGSKIEDYGNGWYRCAITTLGAAGSGNFQVGFIETEDDGRLPSFTGNGTDSVYVFGAQLEEQSYPTSYIPTSGSTETRDAETCNGAGSTDEINSTEGVLFFEGRVLADDGVSKRISISDNSGNANNRAVIEFDELNGVLKCFLTSGGTPYGIITADRIVSSVDNLKVALSYSVNNFGIYVNGLLYDLDDNVAVMPLNLSTLDFSEADGTTPFYGKVKKLSVYDEALSTTELESLTGFTSFSEMKNYLNYN